MSDWYIATDFPGACTQCGGLNGFHQSGCTKTPSGTGHAHEYTSTQDGASCIWCGKPRPTAAEVRSRLAFEAALERAKAGRWDGYVVGRDLGDED